jgi:hypothetical protein
VIGQFIGFLLVVGVMRRGSIRGAILSIKGAILGAKVG